ncbi:N-acetylgalactosamine 6-sulfatase (GALNS) [Rhodopirellula sallentina SM41]|uniref:N-acetylgalactosamine 6-sulfatase (GALNS) n=1 Tax=Rhodopirellula sallentina SM41 TaxID=1263870 RepID=M5U711_9BACT|nr:N-acetylgalactosamine 6-sulfatase (GALNS) [Rhodopirellula sallentina SM41]
MLRSARGFEEYFSGVSNVYTASHGLDGTPTPDVPQLIKESRYRVEVQAEAALSFAERLADDDEPLILYHAPYSPLAPYEAPHNYLDQFAHVENSARHICLAMMARVDDSVGRLVGELRHHEIEVQTLIWYISDNGAPKNSGGFNQSFAGAKGSLLDGGVLVPSIVSWPGQLPEGGEYLLMVSSLDVLPTCLAVAGVTEIPQDLTRIDLMPFLKGSRNDAPHERLFFRWTFRGIEQAAIRSDLWKLLRTGKLQSLFDLVAVPGETQDATSQNPVVANEQQQLDGWIATLPAVAESPKHKPRRFQERTS